MQTSPAPTSPPATGTPPVAGYGLAAQLAIYGDTRPLEQSLPIAPEEWAHHARAALGDATYGYVANGAGSEATMRANLAAFDQWRIWPRMLRDVATRDLGVELLGHALPAPVLLAPIGVQGILHPEGEAASARAAAAEGVPFVLSTVSSVPLEMVARAMDAVRPAAPRWFQLYPGRDREVMTSMVRRAETAGYSAIVVTLDTPMLGWREHDLRHRYLPFLQGLGLANYFTDPAFRGLLAHAPEEDPRSAVEAFLRVYLNPSFGWGDLRVLREATRLPLVLKGILHPDDAREAVRAGADAIVVSNHGGRQVDGAVAALDALPPVQHAVERAGGLRVPVLMDSGIRRGADVLKAVALGARAVMLGRPYAYALAVAGETGVRHAVRNLLADVDLELALSGHASVRLLDRALFGPDT